MTVQKALNEKNRLVGVIADLAQKIQRSNSRQSSVPQKFDVTALLKQLFETIKVLAYRKAQIAAANAGAASVSATNEKIFYVAELKSIIAQIKSIDTTEGKVKAASFHASSEIEHVCQWTDAQVSDLVTKIEEAISSLSDELAAHNAATQITDSVSSLQVIM